MDRRQYLAAVGTLSTAALAGCSSEDGGGTVDGEKTAPASEADTDQPTGDSETNTGGDTDETMAAETTESDAPQTETDTATPSGDADINIAEGELVVEEGEYSTTVYVAAEVENRGDATSGMIELTAEWFDADGNYLDNDSQYLSTLQPGETWLARVEAIVSDPEQIEDFSLGGEFNDTPNFNPEGLTIESSEMQANEDEVVVTGKVANERGESIDYIEAIGQIYNGDGQVLGDAWTNTTDVPADRTWSFEVSWLAIGRASEAADHTVYVTDSAI